MFVSDICILYINICIVYYIIKYVINNNNITKCRSPYIKSIISELLKLELTPSVDIYYSIENYFLLMHLIRILS